MAPRPPDFLCIGASKAGTTWLYYVLKECPGYWMPDVKELKYFGPNQRSIDWYFDMFSDAGDRITGDVSPTYSALPIPVITRAKEIVPDAMIVVMVRKPADRNLSLLIQLATRRVFGGHKFDAVAELLADRLGIPIGGPDLMDTVIRRLGLPISASGDINLMLEAYNRMTSDQISLDAVPKLLGKPITVDDLHDAIGHPMFLRHCKQAEFIRNWQQIFGERSVHMLLHDDVVADPVSAVRDVTDFLGRPSLPADAAIVHHNFNPGIYGIEGLQEFKAELNFLFEGETDQLRELLGAQADCWRTE